VLLNRRPFFRVVTSLSAHFLSNLSVLASSSKRVLSSRRSQRCGFCPPDLPNFGEQLAESDDRLFNRIRCNPQHVLHSLLPLSSAASQNYGLRPRRHDKQLPAHTSHLMDCDFLCPLCVKIFIYTRHYNLLASTFFINIVAYAVCYKF